MRRLPLYVALLCALSLAIAGPRGAAAQTVTVPTFHVAAPASAVATGVDLAQGADGAVLFVWDELRAGFGYSVARARHSADGGALPIGPSMTGCCTPRPPYARLAAYAATGYARLLFAAYPQSFTAISSQLDPLGSEVPDTTTVVNPTVGGARRDEAHGGAVATYGDSTFHLLWDDVTGDVVGRRLNGYPVLNGAQFVAGASDPQPWVAIAAIPDHGLVAGWGSASGAMPPAIGVVADASGTFAAPFTLSADTLLRRLVVSPRGDRFALVGTRPRGSAAPTEIWGRYFDVGGTPLGPDFAVHAASGGAVVDPDAAFDLAGNLYVVWTEGGTAVRTVGVSPAGTPSGAPVTLATGTALGNVRAIRLADPALHDTGRFMNAWTAAGGVDANVASPCTPGTSTCGDGVRAPFCELCDDGAANSDSAPDACRVDCRPARCGDGVLDTGESCDDGNLDDCDGCSATCTVEPAAGCGNGLAMPACGELCDDGNTEDGDGCSATCQNEFVAGGGAPTQDCVVAWSVDNPANAPRFAKKGNMNPSQTCTDNDPRCDFDGGAVGGCTFKLRVCAAVSTLPPCVPPERLASWQLDKPSANEVATRPDAAQVAAALNGAVPGAIVGPLGPDICSDDALVVVPLRGEPGRFHAAKRALRATATLYDGRKDTDKLTLRCVPGS